MNNDKNKAKFTPGPWNVLSTGKPAMPGGKYYMVWNQGRGRRMLVKIPYTDCAKQDAHLIAAAPDMFEALEAALDYIGDALPDGFPDHPSASEDDRDLIFKLQRALAKARGES